MALTEIEGVQDCRGLLDDIWNRIRSAAHEDHDGGRAGSQNPHDQFALIAQQIEGRAIAFDAGDEECLHGGLDVAADADDGDVGGLSDGDGVLDLGQFLGQLETPKNGAQIDLFDVGDLAAFGMAHFDSVSDKVRDARQDTDDVVMRHGVTTRFDGCCVGADDCNRTQGRVV